MIYFLLSWSTSNSGLFTENPLPRIVDLNQLEDRPRGGRCGEQMQLLEVVCGPFPGFRVRIAVSW